MKRLLQGRGGLISSAGVRVGGAVLVVVGLVVGVRVLGPTQYGVSVLVLAVGQLAAFPLTAMERLVVRLVAQGDHDAAARAMRKGDIAATAAVLLGAAIAVVAYLLDESSAALFAFASGVTVASAGLVTMRQGACRAAGRLGWGQMPNELFRPLVTLISYPVALALLPEVSGALATLLASGATLVLILCAPRVVGRPDPAATKLPPGAGGARSGTAGAAMALMWVSAAALAVERLYPVVLGWTSSAAAVTAFAVAMRVIQMANFTQAFAVFYYSPQLARAAKDSDMSGESSHITRRIRLMGLLSAAPAAALCLFIPGALEHVLGQGLDLAEILRVSVIAILMTAIGSPAQTLLIMSGRERVVAISYGAGVIMSAVAFVFAGANGALDAIIGLAVAMTTWSLLQMLAVRREFGAWH